MMRENRIALLAIVTGSLLHLAFYVISNLHHLTNSMDLILVSGFLHNFTDSLFSGTLYPRWMGSLFYGTGAPVFIYYSPLAYYISSLLRLPFSIDPYGVYQLGLSLSAGLLVTSLAYYYWLRRHTSVRDATVIACLLYILPYRFDLMHCIMALAQIWASAWVPIGFYCIEKWHERGDRRFLLWLAVVVAGLIVTHLPSAVMFVPLLVLYGLLYRAPSWKSMGMLFCSLGLAAGLSAFYWLPAAINQDSIQARHYYYFVHDLDIFFNPVPYIMAVPFLCLAAGVLLMSFSRKAVNPLLMRAMALCTLGLTLLLSSLSRILWDHVIAFQIIQAPMRLVALMVACFPLFMIWLRKHLTWSLCLIIVFFTALPSGWGVYVIYSTYRTRSYLSDIPNTPVAIQQGILRQLQEGYTPSEYATRWMPEEDYSPEHVRTIYSGIAKVQAAKATLQILTWQDEKIILHVATDTEDTITLREHYYPAWIASGSHGTLPIAPSPLGLIQIKVPPGSQDITLQFGAPPGAEPGELTALAALCLWLGLYYAARNRRERAPS